MFFSQFYNGVLDVTFLQLGVQNYLLARFGSRENLNPTAGALFHHAFELLIKSYLVNNGFDREQLKSKKFGHNLVFLWKEFKKVAKIKNDDITAFLDLQIDNLDMWEKIRYMQFEQPKPTTSVEIRIGNASDTELQNIKSGYNKQAQHYVLYTDDMDRLFLEFFVKLSIPLVELITIPDIKSKPSLITYDNKWMKVEDLKV